MSDHLRHPRRTLSLVALGLGLLAFLGIWRLVGWRWYWAWWTGFSAVTFLAYGFDKLQAGKETGQRVPEFVLHLLAFAGGVAGAWVGRFLFRHKTHHAVFTILLVLATALHAAICWLALQGG